MGYVTVYKTKDVFGPWRMVDRNKLHLEDYEGFWAERTDDGVVWHRIPNHWERKDEIQST